MTNTILSDYETWADVYYYNNVLYCVYTETVDKEDHSESSIEILSSADLGKTLGYTGMDIMNDTLVTVNVRRSRNIHNTLIEKLV